jgi:hypothetical protein
MILVYIYLYRSTICRYAHKLSGVYTVWDWIMIIVIEPDDFQLEVKCKTKVQKYVSLHWDLCFLLVQPFPFLVEFHSFFVNGFGGVTFLLSKWCCTIDKVLFTFPKKFVSVQLVNDLLSYTLFIISCGFVLNESFVFLLSSSVSQYVHFEHCI